MKYNIEDVSNSIEQYIIVGMIVDTQFFKDISRAAKPEYFTSDNSKILVHWLRDYYFQNDYNSPGEEIREIFELNQDELDDDERKTTRLFLKRTIDEYTGKEFNRKYILPKALAYLEKNAYQYKLELAKKALRRDDLVEAKNIFESTGKEVFDETTTWRNLSNRDLINSWWGKRKEPVMSFPGELGRYMPPIYRGKLYAMFGPAKRGKSHWLLYWAYNGAVERLKVAVFSLEMDEEEVDERWITLLSGKPIMNEDSKIFTVPVVDCLHNQTGKCKRPECPDPDHVVYAEKNKIKSPYPEHKDYVPCIHCRGTDMYKPASWLEEVRYERLTKQKAMKLRKSFGAHFGNDNVRLKSFPISTATVNDLESALNDLEIYENFIPDMVVVDYADILKEDLRLGDKRHRVGDNWKQLSRMAKTRNIVVVTASQGNRSSATKNRISVDDISEDFSKIMTVDGIFAINEENYDKQNMWQMDANWQVQRIETLALRYSKFVPGLQCVTLNDLSRGQICIDSFIDWR